MVGRLRGEWGRGVKAGPLRIKNFFEGKKKCPIKKLRGGGLGP